MAQPAIIAEGLTYRYGQLTAVDHISFSVAAGEILGFLGPNGAGKSTTVKMLSGQLRPKEGRAALLGIDVASQPKQAQARIGVRFEIANLAEVAPELAVLAVLDVLLLTVVALVVRRAPASEGALNPA